MVRAFVQRNAGFRALSPHSREQQQNSGQCVENGGVHAVFFASINDSPEATPSPVLPPGFVAVLNVPLSSLLLLCMIHVLAASSRRLVSHPSAAWVPWFPSRRLLDDRPPVSLPQNPPSALTDEDLRVIEGWRQRQMVYRYLRLSVSKAALAFRRLSPLFTNRWFRLLCPPRTGARSVVCRSSRS